MFQSRKRSSSLKSASIFCFALCASAAFGQSAGYSYAFTGTGISGSGDVYLTGTDADGVYAVQSISGQVNGIQITGLLPAGTYNGNDNLFYDNDTFLDDGGVAFALAGGADVDIYFNTDVQDYYFQGDGTFELENGNAPQPAVQPQGRFRSFLQVSNPDPAIALDSFTFEPLNASVTPEPSSLLLLGTGVGALAGLIRRKR